MATKKNSKLKTYLDSNFIEFNSNSDRLKALYSDFSKLWILNKYGYDSHVSYWRRIILDCNQQGYLRSVDYAIVIDQDTIAEQFQRSLIGKPLALDCVIEQMIKEEELIPLEDYNTKFALPTTWFGWIVDTVIKNTWQWRWRSEGLSHPSKHYVVLPTVKAIAKSILSQHLSHGNNNRHLMTLSQFKQLYSHHFVNEIELTDADLSLLLRYLHSQHGVALADHVKGYGTTYMIIKFPEREDQTATITQNDEALINIRTTCYALSVQVDELQKKSEELGKEALEEKKKGHKAKAFYCLKRKKNLQEVLERRLKSMETMDTILMKIESSQDDIQVIQAFNMGAKALKNLLGKDGLSVESVDDAMEKIQSVLQDQKEIEEALRIGTEDINDVDDQEIENELNELIKDYDKVAIPPSKHVTDHKEADDDHVQSELSRLNHLFSSVKNTPTNLSSENQTSANRKQEFAS
ncbi:Snf7-domain-containing protein [Cokeromyces recurvatus]|uniref:Snf7-domain-containing protein n=1 Tax=Cokeromyces recurvatus TaxID=90255 RepID=UPI00221E9D51|nr:Snf7-domain-containing protein [Cokeromyces recurvatus]KAI7897525.1 Snf7-domain-containing protein [Cokeromyces recurvatus]